MTFFDVTPSGRVVNRFSRDAFSVDDPLPFHLNVLLAQVRFGLVTPCLLPYFFLFFFGPPELLACCVQHVLRLIQVFRLRIG